MTVRFGVVLPTLEIAGRGSYPVADAAVLAEELGFDSVWAVDHLAFHTGLVEPVTALAVAAAVTRRVRLGFGVLLAAMRQPAWVAKQIASLQVLSGHRVLLGVGVGGENPAEWAAAGIPRDERGRRTDVLLDALPTMLSGRAVRLPSPYDLDVPDLAPAALMPPVWIGGRSEAALTRAARRGDGWLGLWLDAGQLARRAELLGVLARHAGRPAPSVGMTVFVNVDDRDPARARREAAAFLGSVYALTPARFERYLVAGGSAEVTEQLAAMVAAGAEQLTLLPAAVDYRTQYERLALMTASLAT
ncbi:LLM class flavin-dependent oxidoreductase [Amycolatopsis sp. NPDC088138]|uniref:LLM class flavin-dependent oxidoreductase n=1 Tax=Amycolatopsis sp. NPDC088138 TaxID=3363938 RepID=UPI0038173B1B